jgi:Domain of unknown function (DUF6933)
VSAIPSRW